MDTQVNRSALPTVFGFDFQEVAGLILMLLERCEQSNY